MPPAHAGSDVKQLGELAVREVAHARPELALALLRVNHPSSPASADDDAAPTLARGDSRR